MRLLVATDIFLAIIAFYVYKDHALTQTIAIYAFHCARSIRERERSSFTIQPYARSLLYHERVEENVLWDLRPFIDDDQIAHCVVLLVRPDKWVTFLMHAVLSMQFYTAEE